MSDVPLLCQPNDRVSCVDVVFLAVVVFCLFVVFFSRRKGHTFIISMPSIIYP